MKINHDLDRLVEVVVSDYVETAKKRGSKEDYNKVVACSFIMNDRLPPPLTELAVNDAKDEIPRHYDQQFRREQQRRQDHPPPGDSFRYFERLEDTYELVGPANLSLHGATDASAGMVCLPPSAPAPRPNRCGT